MTHQTSFIAQPPHTQPRDTRAAAHDSVQPNSASLRSSCLAVLQRRAGTADEVASELGETVLAIRPRITELVKAELIYDTGERRDNTSGRRAKVWRAR